MTDETMIERVARAIDPVIWSDDLPVPTRAETVAFHERRQISINKARAAIEAMREPTEKMHNAARDWSRAKYGICIGFDASKGCWKAMIEAALEEGESHD